MLDYQSNSVKKSFRTIVPKSNHARAKSNLEVRKQEAETIQHEASKEIPDMTRSITLPKIKNLELSDLDHSLNFLLGASLTRRIDRAEPDSGIKSGEIGS